MKLKILFLLLLLSSHLSYGQQNAEKFLLELYQKANYSAVVQKADSILLADKNANKARVYLTKADALYFLNDVEASLENYLIALENLKDYPIDSSYILDLYSNIGFCYAYLGNDVNALPYYEKALEYAISTNDSSEIPTQAAGIGHIYTRLNNLEKAKKYYQQSYAISFARKDSVALAYDLMDLGALMFRMEDYPEAIKYYLKGIKVEKTVDKNHNTHTLRLNKLADAYLMNRQVDSADFYVKKALKKASAIKDSLSLHKIWLVKAEIYIAKEKYDSAFLLASRCRNYFTVDTFSRYEIDAYKTLIMSEILSGQPQAALKILNDFIPRLKENQQVESLSVFLLLRSQVLEDLNRLKESIEDLKLSQLYKDSLRLAKRESAVLSLSKLYDTKDKELKIELLENKTALQRSQAENERRFRIILIFAVILLVVLAAFFYQQYQVKRKNSQLLQDRNKALSELNHTKDQLFAIVSHDLRNPVSAFRNMTEALEQNFDQLPPEKMVNYLKKMHLNASEIESQLNDLLAWASQEIGKQKIKTQLLAIEPMVAQVFNLLQPIAEIKGVKLEYELDDHCQLNTHPELFKTVIRNLINNAIKFTDNGGLVKLVAKKETENIIFEIIDNGIGIEQDQLKLLFSDQAIKANEKSGMGMGLSLTKEIMERLEGEINVESQLNKGTTFTLKFAA